MTVSLRTRLIIGSSAALAVLGVIVMLTYMTTRGYMASSREATRVRMRLLVLEQTLSAARDVETGQRGFLITGEERYLAPYAAALGDMVRVRARLDSLAEVPGIDREAIATTHRLLDVKLQELARSIEAYRTEGPEAAQRIVRSEEGRRTMDSLRSVVAALEAGQVAAISATDAAVRRDAARTLVTVTVLALLAFVLFGAVCLLLWRTIQEGRLREQQLDARVREQTSVVGRLNADLTRRVAEVETLLAVVPIGIGFASDPECRDIRLNPAFARMLRLSGDSNASKTGPAAAHLPFRVMSYERQEIPAGELVMQRAARLGAPIRNDAYQIVFDDGTAIDMLGSAAPLFDEQGRVRGAVGAFVDVSELRRAGERMQHAERLQAVGQLAGGVAHEINNLMTTVLGFAEFALRGLGPEHPVAPDLRQVLGGGRRAAEVAQQLLAFSRRQVAQARVISLDREVADLAPTLERIAGASLRLELVLGASTAHVRLDPGQLHQVLINLAANARDAMPEQGRLTVRTAAVTVGPGGDGGSPGLDLAPGAWAVLGVDDTGTGMDAAARRRAFEPFFTTKEVGRGTGLGLSIVYGIVKEAGGEVRLTSEPGRGTTVEVYLPVVSPLAGGETAPAVAAGGSGERVLLVEDDETVRAMAQRALEEEGYQVTAVGDGEQALRALADREGAVDLLLTDLVMPNLGGRALRRIVAERYPRLPVLYMSGYGGEAAPGWRDGEQPPFLAKPFTPDELVGRVRAVLDRDSRRSRP